MLVLQSTIQSQSQIFLTAGDCQSIILICNLYQVLLRSECDDRQVSLDSY